MLDDTRSELPRVVVLVGLPGSGKSTWAREQGCAVLSSDDVRCLLSDDAENQTIHRQAFATVRDLLRRRLELRRPLTIIDATNLTPFERRPYIRIAELLGCQAEAIFFSVPLEVCKARNASRSRRVPEEAIDLMAAKLTAPEMREGFDRVVIK